MNEQNNDQASVSDTIPPSTTQKPQLGIPKKKSKGLLIGGIVAGVLVILGASAALAYNFWYQNPEKVVTDSIVNVIKAKSMTYTGSVTATGQTKFKIDLTGANDTIASDLAAKVTFSIEGKEYTIDAGARFDKNGDLFFKIKNVNPLIEDFRATLPPESMTIVDQLVAKINDRWIKVSADDLAELDPATSKKQKCLTDAVKKYYEDDKAMLEVAEVYKKNKFIKVEQNLGAKNGSNGYTLTADNKVAEAFLKGIKDTKAYKSLNECDPEMKIDEKEIVKEEDEKSKDKSETKVELWVHSWSHQITKVAVSSDNKETKDQLSMIFEPKFNEKVTIETPQDTITLKQLQAEIQELMTAALTAGMDSEEMTAEDAAAMHELQMSSDL